MYIKLLEADLYYQEIGSGPNLIFLHGWGQDVSSFWGIVELLKNDYKIFLIDLPGFGRSQLAKKAYTVSDYAKTVEEFIKTKNIHSPALLGHSLGGRIAIKLAAQHPELIGKLLLEDAAGIKPKRDIYKSLIYIPAKIFKYFVPDIFNLKTKLRTKFYKNIESDYINAGPLRDTLKNILDEDLTGDLPEITSQTLLIWGENDSNLESSLNNGIKMYQLIKDSRLEVLEGLGHFPHLENPKLFSYYVKEFV